MLKTIFIFLIAFIITFLVTPLFKKLAYKFKFLDMPNHRKIHKKPVSLLGGLAIYLGFLIATLLFSSLTNKLLLILLGSTLMLFLGLIDDYIDMKPKIKFFLPGLAALIIVIAGVRIDSITNEYLSIIFTLFWIIGIVNAFNFIDGLDGLSVGIGFISSIIFAIFAYSTNQQTIFIISLALAGSCLGFLRFNFHPAKIFMGDGGSMFLGFMLSVIAVFGTWGGSSKLSIFVPVAILGYPIFDGIFVTLLRIIHKKKPWIGDTNHSFYRLIRLGFSQKKTVLLLYAISLSLGLFSFLIANLSLSLNILLFSIIIIIFAVFGLMLVNVGTATKESIKAEKRIKNALSFDVEDWYQVENLKEVIKFKDWPKCKKRLSKNINKILNILKQKNVKATFFILGWIAEHYPEIVKKIVKQGHEIATHGYKHTLIYKQKPEKFESELKKSINLIEKITNKKILGHRAASFSITKKSLWAISILKKLGLKYDSSIFPIKRKTYGIPKAPISPYNIKKDFIEFPLSTIYFLGKNIPIGGGYFRVSPYFITKWVIKKANKQNRPAIVYLHPWEFDPDQPKLKISFFKKFRHYTNLDKTEKRFKKLLDDFEFAPVKEVLNLEK